MTLPDGSRAAQIVRIPFHGTEIHAVLVDGKPNVVLRPFVNGLGIDYSNQIRKLKGKSWGTVVPVTTVASDGRIRDMDAVPVRTFLMLLATIDENRVNEKSRKLLVDYQNEVADVIEDYFTEGGAINPRATGDQVVALQDELAEMRAIAVRRDLSVIRELDGIVDPSWRESLGRHAWAVYKGEKPDIAEDDRLLMVEPYLIGRRVSRSDVSAIRAQFGKYLKKAYINEHGHEPGPAPGLVDGRERPMKAYYERDRHLFDAVFDQHYAKYAGPEQLELAAA